MVPLPYIFVWFEAAAAHVHWWVVLLGCTPGLLVAFAGVFVLQLLNLSPPGVSFEVDEADWLVPAEVLVEADADTEVDDDSSAFFACPWLSAAADDAVTLVESFAA